jgi:hypothetical protein
MCAAQRTAEDLLRKIDARLPENVSSAIARSSDRVKGAITAFLTWFINMLAIMKHHLLNYTNSAITVVNERLLPTVKPHVDKVSRVVTARLKPVSDWSSKNITPRYAAFEKQFESETAKHSKLDVAIFAALTAIFAYILMRKIISALRAKSDVSSTPRRTFFSSLPGVRGMIDKERARNVEVFQKAIAKSECSDVTPLLNLPLAGLDPDSVMNELEERAGNDFRYADGESRASGTIYMSGDSHRDLLNDAYCMFSQSNPARPNLFPSVRRMEAEVVAMTASLLGGGHEGNREVLPLTFPSLTGHVPLR